MTDKQIIIDGVDVSRCKWFTHNQLCECAIKPADDFHCHANPDCHYKKWQYKEQECERLKNIINEAKNSKLDLNSFFAIEATVGEYQLELDQLKTENEALKNNDVFSIRLFKDKADKYKQTLTEIKEIALWKNEYWSMPNSEYINIINEILQKISEVE